MLVAMDPEDSLRDLTSGAFLENAGQIANPDVRYYSASGSVRVGFAESAVLFVLTEAPSIPPSSDPRHGGDGLPQPPNAARAVLLRLRFIGANDVLPQATRPLSHPSHFFLGNDPSQWRTNVRSYGEIAYKGLYEGIDLVYRATPRGVKYEFRLDPGTDPSVITMLYEGADGLDSDVAGDMRVQTVVGGLVDSAPVAYQGDDDVPCAFVQRSPRSYGFRCSQVESSRSLVVDPLVYSTYLGGLGGERVHSIAVDVLGNAYVTGETESVDFPPVPGSFNTSFGGVYDAFIAKLDAAGRTLQYSTYLGGIGGDIAYSIALDSGSNATITGSTFSPDFPITPNAFNNASNGDRDVFVARLNAAGDDLVYSTFLGGSSQEVGYAIAVGPAGEAYVAGMTRSTDFPATNGSFNQTYNGGVQDGFLARLDAAGTSLAYATYLGGGGEDWVNSVAFDSTGSPFVTGRTASSDFPTTVNAFDRIHGGGGLLDAFVTKFESDASALVYSTFLGGANGDEGGGIAVDSAGNAYVTGRTSSLDFPTAAAFDPSLGGVRDAFVAKLGPTGESLVYATYFGGGGDDLGQAIAVDAAGNAFVTGGTDSADFPLSPDAVDTSYNGGTRDAFLAGLSATGSSLLYSTFFGGTDWDQGEAVAVRIGGSVYVAGGTNSTDFPYTTGALSADFSGVEDGFVVRIGLGPGIPDLTLSPSDIAFVPPGPASVGSVITVTAIVHNGDDGNASQVDVRFHDGLPAAPNQIGIDQVIPFLPALNGSGTASENWTTSQAGPRDICVVADPDNALEESDETNNVACASFLVLSGPMPDLVVLQSDILPPLGSPYPDGALIWLNATIRNIGGNASGATIARVHAGLPPSPQVGLDQQIPALPVGGTAQVSVRWTATPPGPQDLCVVVDPGDLVNEGNETNNAACITVLVQDPPDYVPLDPQPTTSAVGVSTALTLSLEVWNVGDGAASAAATLAFFNATTPGGPFATFIVPPLDSFGRSARFGATWVSTPVVGIYAVVADVDYDGNLPETNEANNRHEWVIQVVPGPVTTLLIGQPNYTATTTYVTSATPLSLSVLDGSGAGIRATKMRIDAGLWSDYTAPFSLGGEAEHIVEWYSEDFAGNTEATQRATVRVDDTPPKTLIIPNLGPFGPNTTFLLFATDDGSGVALTEYRVDAGGWTPYSGGFSLPPGEHSIKFRSVDLVNNREAEHTFAVTVTGSPAVAQGELPWWLLILVVIGGVVLRLGLSESLRVALTTFFVTLWARLRRRDILDQEKRWLLRGYLAANPGANFAAIRADLEMAVGTLGYHLYVLECEGIVKSWRDGRFRRYALSGHRVAELQPRLTDIELLLLQTIRTSPGIAQRELARQVGVSQPTINYHLRKMVALRVVMPDGIGVRRRYRAVLGDPDAAPPSDSAAVPSKGRAARP